MVLEGTANIARTEECGSVAFRTLCLDHKHMSEQETGPDLAGSEVMRVQNFLSFMKLTK